MVVRSLNIQPNLRRSSCSATVIMNMYQLDYFFQQHTLAVASIKKGVKARNATYMICVIVVATFLTELGIMVYRVLFAWLDLRNSALSGCSRRTKTTYDSKVGSNILRLRSRKSSWPCPKTYFFETFRAPCIRRSW